MMIQIVQTQTPKIEAVNVNGVAVAVRISFKHNGKHYARQYAITDDLTYDQAVALCNKYKDRIIIRSRDEAEQHKLKQKTEEEIRIHALKQQESQKRLDIVRSEILHVLIRYHDIEDQYGYVNVYGRPVTKKPVFY